MIKGLLSVVIPNFNSPFTAKTVQGILDNAGCEVEVIVNVEQNWPELSTDKRVTYIHPPSPIGMRAGINACVALAKGEYILKCDDHVMFGKDFGKILIENHQPNWVQVPRRYALNAEEWKIEERTDNKYPVDYMYLDFPRKGKEHDDGMHGVPWKERRDERDPKLDTRIFDRVTFTSDMKPRPAIDETPSMQGSCWFMTKEYFEKLKLMDTNGYGQFAQEAQEIGFKAWLSGGALMVNKKTWYAHLHKGSRYGKFYKFPGGTIEASNWSAEHWLNDREPGMIHKFKWLINDKFPNMPSWPDNWEYQIKEMGWIK